MQNQDKVEMEALANGGVMPPPAVAPMAPAQPSVDDEANVTTTTAAAAATGAISNSTNQTVTNLTNAISDSNMQNMQNMEAKLVDATAGASIRINNEDEIAEIIQEYNESDMRVLYTNMEGDSLDILTKCESDEKDDSFNQYNRKHFCNFTIGNVEKIENIIDFKKHRLNRPNKRDEISKGLWFAVSGDTHTNALRKVFFSGKIDGISNIKETNNAFQVKMSINLTWLPTKYEYLSYLKAYDNDTLYNWQPRFIPVLDFTNCLEAQSSIEYRIYSNEGRFRLVRLRDFGYKSSEKIDETEFDPKYSYFLRCKLECNLICFEELELNNFPIDCQPLNIVIDTKVAKSGKSGSDNFVLMPELRRKSFFKLGMTLCLCRNCL